MSLAGRLRVIKRRTVFLRRETIDVTREPPAVLVEQAIGPAARNVAPAQCADRCDGFVAADRLKLRHLSVQAFVDLVKQVTAGEPVKQCEQRYRRSDDTRISQPILPGCRRAARLLRSLENIANITYRMDHRRHAPAEAEPLPINSIC